MNEKLFAPNTGIPQLGNDVVEKLKLPDLSATPQILPYQFMGQPVYEVVATIGADGVITALPQYPTYILSVQGMKDSNSYPLHIVYDNGVWKTTDEGADTLDFVYIQYMDYDYNVDNFVDLGLPSGKKWSKMNVGATTETDYGLYFQWGDTQGYTADQVGSGEGKKYFGWADYKYNSGGTSPSAADMTKYNASDGKTVLDLSDDAARANVGFPLRIPTASDFQELINNTDNSWTSIDGVNGYKFQHKQDHNKYIFLPSADSCENGVVYSLSGKYWSSSLDTMDFTKVLRLDFDGRYLGVGHINRYVGLSVRGVVG